MVEQLLPGLVNPQRRGGAPFVKFAINIPKTEWVHDLVAIGKMASPERDEPRSLQQDCFAGTGRARFPTIRWLRRNGTSHVPYKKLASLERDEPGSLQQLRFSGTEQAMFPTKRWLRRYKRLALQNQCVLF